MIFWGEMTLLMIGVMCHEPGERESAAKKVGPSDCCLFCSGLFELEQNGILWVFVERKRLMGMCVPIGELMNYDGNHEFGYVGGLKKLTKGVGSRGLEGDAIRAAKDVLVVFGRMLASGTSWIVCVCAFVEFFICCPEAMHKFDSRTSLIIGGTCHRLFNRVPVDSVTDC